MPVKKGLYEIFDYLKSVGCKISLATSTSSQTALKIMKKINLYDKFDAFVCGDDVKNGKPNPEVFLIAAKKLGLEPVDCVAFEDSINGIKSAHAAGMTTVMVPDLSEPTATGGGRKATPTILWFLHIVGSIIRENYK